MITETVDPTAEMSTAAAAANAAALDRLLAYNPKDPDQPISEGQIALMERFGLKVKKGMTKGKANVALQKFFKANPEIALEYQEERAQRRRDAWAAKIQEYVVLANARSQQTNRVPAHPRQISAVAAAAFIRTDVTEGQRIEARTLLLYGAGSAMASTFLDQLPKRAEVSPN